VRERVVQECDRQDLREVLKAPAVTGAQLAEYIWNRLVSRLSSGALENIRVMQSRDLSFDYRS
jgi:6-pyruvoyltetrahydropterin/6-carboxytetrahydropterin synthase